MARAFLGQKILDCERRIRAGDTIIGWNHDEQGGSKDDHHTRPQSVQNGVQRHTQLGAGRFAGDDGHAIVRPCARPRPE